MHYVSVSWLNPWSRSHLFFSPSPYDLKLSTIENLSFKHFQNLICTIFRIKPLQFYITLTPPGFSCSSILINLVFIILYFLNLVKVLSKVIRSLTHFSSVANFWDSYKKRKINVLNGLKIEVLFQLSSLSFTHKNSQQIQFSIEPHYHKT